jgi:hypothetical protein
MLLCSFDDNIANYRLSVVPDGCHEVVEALAGHDEAVVHLVVVRQVGQCVAAVFDEGFVLWVHLHDLQNELDPALDPDFFLCGFVVCVLSLQSTNSSESK